MERLLHTPEGVRDIYNEECERKLGIQEKMHRVLHTYGFRDIETPSFEFFDVFSRDVGSIPSKELYKFFDREGNTLVLRPDITPSIARAVSKYFADDRNSLRLCYIGNTFVNNSSYQGYLKENTHMGAELIGDDSAAADAETIAMAAACLKAVELEEFQISVGQVEFFKSILRDVEIDEETEGELKDYISNRNIFGVETLLEQLALPEDVSRALLALPTLYGSSVDVLDRAMEIACNDSAKKAICRLQEIYRILAYYDVTKYVSFDLSMLSRYNYYTGIFFRGYTFGSGDAVIKGGRYDNLLKHFGKDAPSIGYVIVVDQLLSALQRQGIQPVKMREVINLHYTEAREQEVIRLAGVMRASGKAVALQRVEKLSAAQEMELEKLSVEFDR